MDTLISLFDGLLVAVRPEHLMYAFIGSMFGTLVGVLPGLGPTAGMALLIPLSATLDPTSAVILIAAIYYGSMYGGSTTAILMNVPGELASVVSSFEGYPMAKAGRAGPALAMAAIASFASGIFAVFLLVLLAPLLAPVALKVGPVELFAIVFVALIAVVNLSGKSLAKGLLACAIGLIIATVGRDPVTATERFAFGNLDLLAGIGFIPVVVGMFAISEVLMAVESKGKAAFEGKLGHLYPTRKEMRQSVGPISRGGLLGFAMGLVPGLTPAAAAFASYDVERRVSKTPQRFGKGAIEGLAGPEAANNGAVGGGMVPLFTLGIPTTPTIAVLLGAFLVQGITPGPLIFDEHPDVVWPFIASMLIGNVILLILNLPLVGMWARIVLIPYGILLPLIVLVSFVGVYSINSRPFDILVMLAFGILGYVLRRNDIPLAPLILALVIEPILEPAFRQSLAIGGGSPLVFLQSPASVILLILALGLLATGIVARRKKVSSLDILESE